MSKEAEKLIVCVTYPVAAEWHIWIPNSKLVYYRSIIFINDNYICDFGKPVITVAH